MIVEFWGARGSIPVSGKQFLKYGGNTPCLSIVTRGGDMVILDAGSGLRNLSDVLPAPAGKGAKQTIHMLLSHFHMDHLMGLPLFAPLYSDRTIMNFYSPLPPAEIEKNLNGFTGDKYFPIPFGQTASVKNFLNIGPEGIKIGSLKITALAVNHPQGAFAYRIEEGDSSIVIATDAEPDGDTFNMEFIEFSKGADCLVWDSAFSPAEFRRRRGWGHGTWIHGVKFAKAAGIERLVLDHFSPEHNDHRIKSMLARAREMFPRTIAAHEGLSLRIEGGKKERKPAPAEAPKKRGRGRKKGARAKAVAKGRTAGSRAAATAAKTGKSPKTEKTAKTSKAVVKTVKAEKIAKSGVVKKARRGRPAKKAGRPAKTNK